MSKGILFTEISTNKTPYRLVYEWSAYERFWAAKPREWFVGYSAVFVFFISLSALLGQYLLVLAIISFSFLWFIQATIEPSITRHQVTNLGIKSLEQFFRWSDIRHFWFSKKQGIFMLHLETIVDMASSSNLSNRITLVLNSEDSMFELFEVLNTFCDYGDKVEVSYNFLMNLIHGEHISIDTFLENGEVDFKESTLTEEN